MHHACHPTTMDGENMMFTSDWPGVAVSRLEARFREDKDQPSIVTAMLLNGCCGDINPNPRGTWQDVERAGNLVANAAYGARWSSHGTLDDKLFAQEVELNLPLVSPPDSTTCKAEISMWEKTLADDMASDAAQGKLLFDQAHLEWHKLALSKNEGGGPHIQPFTIQHLNLGGVHLLGFPAEMFVEYQLYFHTLTNASLFALSYTNGCYGYMPTASEHPRGGYEVNEANKYYGALAFAPGCEGMICNAVEKMVAS